jgi:exonuclease 1
MRRCNSADGISANQGLKLDHGPCAISLTRSVIGMQALKAEKVAYVVAPYEADAQMAYLERVGLVDGILTEDSDLLVFGCQNVLLKLDTVESTVVSISRKDFASLASTSGGGISLLGWSDVEFRTMAILSGCDYLASIPGVGLKTAWSLLRKHRTVENVVSALRMEGKKTVPKGYLQAFKLAEKVFLHQRVYDPIEKTLIHLSATPSEGLDAGAEAYVGE